jgi:hypothetical protein
MVSLNKPTIGSQNWGGDVNDNWDTIETALNAGSGGAAGVVPLFVFTQSAMIADITHTIPAGTLDTDGQRLLVRVSFRTYSMTAGSIQITFGGQDVYNVALSDTAANGLLTLEIIRTGASAQVCVGQTGHGTDGGSGGYLTATVDLTSGNDLVANFNPGSGQTGKLYSMTIAKIEAPQ